MRCTLCEGPIVLLSGKGSGYYGCYNSKRHKCTNHLLVPRKRLETAILSELQNRILTTENIEYVYKNVEQLAKKELNDVPELIKRKKVQFERLQSEIHNYLNYIKKGNFSKAVSEALQQVEAQSEGLKRRCVRLNIRRHMLLGHLRMNGSFTGWRTYERLSTRMLHCRQRRSRDYWVLSIWNQNSKKILMFVTWVSLNLTTLFTQE